jgi:hypothetical protein
MNWIPEEIASRIEDYKTWMALEIIASRLVMAKCDKPELFDKSLKKPIRVYIDQGEKLCFAFFKDSSKPYSLGCKLYNLKRMPKGCDMKPLPLG